MTNQSINPSPITQVNFTKSNTVPVQCLTREEWALEKAGVIFGAVVFEYPSLRYVQLPQGWKIVETDKPDGFDMLDNKGRKRAFITFRDYQHFDSWYGVWYRRYANLSIKQRFSPGADTTQIKQGIIGVSVYDQGEEIFTSNLINDERLAQYESVSEKVFYGWEFGMDAARAWLDEQYPNWKDPSAYWD